MKTWIILTALALPAIAAPAPSDAGVTVHVRYEDGVPPALVMRAERRAAQRFASIGVPVRFLSGRKGKANPAGEVHFDLQIRMQPPAGASSSALAHAHPYDTGSPIVIFYSPVDAYRPAEYRDALLGYVFAHEIGHVLEGIVRHSESGVMKANWNRADFDRMHQDNLLFHPADADLIRAGLAKLTLLQMSAR